MLLVLTLVLPMQARHSTYFRLRGEQMYMEGRFLEALEMFQKYEDGNPDEVVYDEPYLHRKAEVNYKLGRFDEALNSYKLVLDTDPENVNYSFFKGLIYRSSEPTSYSHILAIIDSVHQDTYAKYSFLDTVRRFHVEPFFPLNTEFSEFGAVDFNGRIYFASLSDRRFTKKDVNTELSHYDIYSVDHTQAHEMFNFGERNYSDLDDSEKKALKEAKEALEIRYEDAINTSYNNGPITFYNDDVAFLTVNEVHRKRDEGIYNLTLKEVSLSKDSAESFEKTATHYFGRYFSPADVGQITFTKDRKMACMAVKIKDSPTESDLWFSRKNENGSWGIPYLAGDTINTVHDDLFPWFSEDDYLYYATDGLKGIGGLDIFRIDLLDPRGLPHNVGLGINSPYDDFAFCVDSMGNGYFTSNRAGGHGADDIYTLAMNYGYIKVVLLGDTAWVDNPIFALNESRGNKKIDSVNVKLDTSYVTQVLPYGEYDLMHSFPVDSQYEHIALYEDTVTVYVQFTKIPPDTLPVNFTNFCFDCDGQDEINNDKFKRIVKFLLAFPEIEVELTGNTDMFGTHKYNDALGMRRADIMEQWMREAGVVNPVVKSSNGKRQLISTTDHRLNRRVDVALYWPGDTARIEFVSNEDQRLERDVAIEYDAAKLYNERLIPGYYILVYRSRHFMKEEECAEKYGLGSEVDILLHSNQWNKFSYYLNVPFDSALEAQELIEGLGLRAKVVYLR